MSDTYTPVVVGGRIQTEPNTPIVYVARYLENIIGVFGKVSDAEKAVAAHRAETGNGHAGYEVHIVPFFGRIWRRWRGESDE